MAMKVFPFSSLLTTRTLPMAMIRLMSLKEEVVVSFFWSLAAFFVLSFSTFVAFGELFAERVEDFFELVGSTGFLSRMILSSSLQLSLNRGSVSRMFLR